MNSPPSENFDQVLKRIKAALNPVGELRTAGTLTTSEREYPLIQIVLGKGNPNRVLISGGIHGDEPAGVQTIVSFLENRLYLDFLNHWEITLLPCINPSGYDAGTRNNYADIDLNRKFKENRTPTEVTFVKDVFGNPYQLDLELHEDVDSSGYYLYQKEPSKTLSPLGRIILDQVEPLHPLNTAEEIEGIPADRGLLSRLSDPDEMEWWPMALYAYQQGCRHIFTLESSPEFPMKQRVNAHLKAIKTALDFVLDREI